MPITVAGPGVLAVNKTKISALTELTFYWMDNKEHSKSVKYTIG